MSIFSGLASGSKPEKIAFRQVAGARQKCASMTFRSKNNSHTSLLNGRRRPPIPQTEQHTSYAIERDANGVGIAAANRRALWASR